MGEVQQRIEGFIRFYNNERIQIKFKKQTPIDYRLQCTA
ncbi:IS3 family transposase [Paenibacillus gorillae]